MKLFAPALLAAAILAILPTSPSEAQAPKVNVSRVQESVVMIKIARTDGQEGVCSGFVVDAGGRVVTAEHCVDDANALSIDGELTHVLKTKDGAALLDGNPGVRPPLPLAKDLPKQLDSVWVFGSPNGWGNFVFERRVASILQLSDTNHHDVFIDGEIGFGMSGGPIVNPKGEVVAINQMTFSPGGFGMGCGVDLIKQLLK